MEIGSKADGELSLPGPGIGAGGLSLPALATASFFPVWLGVAGGGKEALETNGEGKAIGGIIGWIGTDGCSDEGVFGEGGVGKGPFILLPEGLEEGRDEAGELSAVSEDGELDLAAPSGGTEG